jgi:small conductance mechanosensitive channel
MLTFSHGLRSERLAGEPMYARMARQVRQQALESAKRARAQVALLVPLIVAVVLAYTYRDEAFGLDLPIRIGCVIALVILGWAFAMNLGRAVGPALLAGSVPAPPGLSRRSAISSRAPSF